MQNYLIISLRTLAGYAFLFFLMKIMGKREIGQLSLFDLIIILSIADIMVFGIDGYDKDILYSFIPMLIVTLLQKLVAFIAMRTEKFRKIFDGKESYIIIDGKVNIKEMTKQKYNMDDLYTQLREGGVKAVEEVETAVLEASGNLSIFKNNKKINSTLPIIISGQINKEALLTTRKTKEWIYNELKEQNVNISDVLGASIINDKLKIVETI